ncbi:MAG TPA: glycerophosphodiester phosphodiesterase [Acidimicrobiia bacterium]|nr:glycerophosphodiester phosphodiesterase [Acidimicrobiia bacterium]
MSNLLFRTDRPVGIAHRGSRLLWPENTMTSFGGATDLGYRFLETDLRVTGDGVLVAFHDANLDRTTDGRGPITQLSWEQVARFDAGFNHRVGSSFPFRGQGIGVPRFEDLARALPQHGWILDLKSDGSVEVLARMLQEMDMTDRVIVGSFSGDRVTRFRRLTGGKVATSTSPQETIEAVVEGSLRGLLTGPAEALHIPITWYGVPIVTSHLVKAAHAADRLIHVWTINRFEDMGMLLELGVDGLITDRPDLLQPLLG